VECESEGDGELLILDDGGHNSRASYMTGINKEDSEDDSEGEGFVYDGDGLASFERDEPSPA